MNVDLLGLWCRVAISGEVVRYSDGQEPQNKAQKPCSASCFALAKDVSFFDWAAALIHSDALLTGELSIYRD